MKDMMNQGVSQFNKTFHMPLLWSNILFCQQMAPQSVQPTFHRNVQSFSCNLKLDSIMIYLNIYEEQCFCVSLGFFNNCVLIIHVLQFSPRRIIKQIVESINVIEMIVSSLHQINRQPLRDVVIPTIIIALRIEQFLIKAIINNTEHFLNKIYTLIMTLAVLRV